MNFYNSEASIDPEVAQRIYQKLAADNELTQSLYSLFYQIYEKNPGEKFTRYARKEKKDLTEGSESLRGSLPNDQPQPALNESTGVTKKKKSLQLSKAWEKPVEKTVEKTVDKPNKPIDVNDNPVIDKTTAHVIDTNHLKTFEVNHVKDDHKKSLFVLDSHQKVIDKFKEFYSTIKPHSSLVNFERIPILDLKKKPSIEESEFFKARRSSFHKVI